MSLALGIAAAVLAASSSSAGSRYALVIGHNEGAANEVPLRYAQLDAERVTAVLSQFGGFRPQDTITMVSSSDDAAAVLVALDELEAKIRADAGPTLLVVYYSGHASQSALHLGPSELNLRVLDSRLQASPASTRLLVLDACRSGSVTRVKGEGPFPSVGASGYAVLAASSADEDAAESEQLQGSFFTHSFTSGLLGPADHDDDGQVTLNEAYQHAFDHTVRLSMASSAAVQHPTFRYDLKGRTDVVLTRFASNQSMVVAPNDARLLLLSSGRVVAEVTADDASRTIAVVPGRYEVVARTQDAVYEGEIDVAANQSVVVDLSALRSSSFARLARKGGEHDVHHAVIGMAVGPLLLAGTLPPSVGFQLHVPVTLSWATVTPRMDVTSGWADTATTLPKSLVHQTYVHARLTTMISMVFDASWASLSLGALAGGHVVYQSTARSFGYAPDDVVFAFGLIGGVDAAVQVPLFERWFVEAGLEGSLSTITEGTLVLQGLSTQLSSRLLFGWWF